MTIFLLFIKLLSWAAFIVLIPSFLGCLIYNIVKEPYADSAAIPVPTMVCGLIGFVWLLAGWLS